jgi:hypothetical protein
MRGVLALALALLAAACTSPEATRRRAGGPGADVGNHGRTVELHGGAEPYAGTPLVIGPAARGGAEVAASPRGR